MARRHDTIEDPASRGDAAAADRPAGGSRSPSRSRSRSPRACWTGAAVGLAVMTGVLFAWSAWDQVIPEALGPSLRYNATSLAVILAVGLVVWLVLRVLRRWLPVSPWFGAALAIALVFVLTAKAGVSRLGWYAVALALLVLAALVGGAASALLRQRRQRRQRRHEEGSRPTRVTAVLVLASIALVSLVLWILRPWSGSQPVDIAAVDITAEVANGTGDVRVESFTYGSGTDRLRPAYGDQVRFRTRSVDASSLLTGWGAGEAEDRTALWGFDASALPVNGRVWYPSGPPAARLPLVLIVHGNKSDVTFSDEGYAYLGEHLARRGYAVASIDENFLGTTILDGRGIGGLENARAWLVSQHLREWRENAANPLRGRVDLSRIALIGHSRGGGAVAQAAASESAGRSCDPAPTAAPDRSGSERSGSERSGSDRAGSSRPGGIRAVIGLAPTDPPGPRGDRASLRGLDYLVLHGAQDVDVVSFEGLGHLDRVELCPGNVKASAYLGHADHSQFNTDWGNRDVGVGLPKRLIDTGTLMSGDAQRRLTERYVTAFLDRSLAADEDQGSALLPVFSRAPVLGATSPQAGPQRPPQRTSYAAAGDTVLLDPVSGPARGVTATPHDFATAEVTSLPMRLGPSARKVVRLAWGEGATARYDVTSANGLNVPADGAILLDVTGVPGGAATRLVLEVRDRDGRRASTRIELPDPVPGRSLLLASMQSDANAEPAPDTVTIPVRDLVAAEPGLDPTRSATLSLRPDGPAGEAYLHRVAVSRTSPTR